MVREQRLDLAGLGRSASSESFGTSDALWRSMHRSLLAAPSPPRSVTTHVALAAKGFRPFFLTAAAFAAAIVPLWLLVLANLARPTSYLPAVVWHAHEMVFGFAVAVLAGFLLTAVSNWTGRETAVGAPLLLLVGLWLAGRVVMLFPNLLPRPTVAMVDLAFLPALDLAIARPLVATRNRRNFVMVAVLAALFVANLVVHLDANGVLPGEGRRACLVALDGIVLLIILITGRVVPMFTRNATGDESVRGSPRLDALTAGAMAILLLMDAAVPASPLVSATAGAVGVLAIARSRGWKTARAFRHPLLWILHVGYAWVPVGMLLRTASWLVPSVPASLATHALTVGAIGSLTLGMMARVALGHSGRALVAPRPMSLAFTGITAAALVRVFGPLALPGRYMGELVVAGSLWTCAFLIYLARYAPILSTPRVDGKAG